VVGVDEGFRPRDRHLSSDPAAGFRTGYIDAGMLVIALGLIAAILIHPQADLRRVDRSGRFL